MPPKKLALNKPNIKKVLWAILSAISGLSEDKITFETSIVPRTFMSEDTSHFDIDSLDQAELLIDIEEAFYLDISEKEAEMFSTVKNLFDYIVENTEKGTLPINWEIPHNQ